MRMLSNLNVAPPFRAARAGLNPGATPEFRTALDAGCAQGVWYSVIRWLVAGDEKYWQGASTALPQGRETYRWGSFREELVKEEHPDNFDAELLLRLYDLRREAKLRQGREWFTREFQAKSFEDYLAQAPPGSEKSALIPHDGYLLGHGRLAGEPRAHQ